MTNKEIMECIIVAALLVGNLAAMATLLKMVYKDIVHIVRGEEAR